MIVSPQQISKKDSGGRESGSDTDFAAAGESDDDTESVGKVSMRELEAQRGRSAQGTRARSKAKTLRTPQKKAAPATRQTVSAKKVTPKRKASSLVKPRPTPRKKTPQKPVTSAKEQPSRSLPKTPSGSVQSPVTPSNAAGRTKEAPENSDRRLRASPKTTIIPDKKEGAKGTKPEKISSEMPAETQAGTSKNQFDSVTVGGIKENAGKAGEAQGVIAGPSNNSTISSVSLNAHESQAAVSQHKANETFLQTSTDSLQGEHLSHKTELSCDHKAPIRPVEEILTHTQVSLP
jgi:hypothetical protein